MDIYKSIQIGLFNILVNQIQANLFYQHTADGHAPAILIISAVPKYRENETTHLDYGTIGMIKRVKITNRRRKKRFQAN